MLYKVVLTFEFVNEILKCDHSNESYLAVLSCGAVYYAVQGATNFESVDKTPKFNILVNFLEQYFPVVLFIMPYKVRLISVSVGETPKCNHPNESY